MRGKRQGKGRVRREMRGGSKRCRGGEEVGKRTWEEEGGEEAEEDRGGYRGRREEGGEKSRNVQGRGDERKVWL